MADKQETEAIEELTKSARDPVVAVDTAGLLSARRRVSLSQYLLEMWRYRRFVVEYSRHKAIADNDDMFLGKLWTILEPLLRIAMYAILFGLILNTSRGIDNFLGFLILGLTFFSQLSRGLSGGSGLIQRSRAMMRTFKFPRASLVLAEAFRGIFSNLVPIALAIAAALLFQWDKPVSWTVILILPLLVLIYTFSLGLMFISARITAFLPDAKKIVFFVNRAWFYVSGVFFSVERYASVPELQTAMMANPGYKFLEAVRDVVLYASVPDLTEWLVLSAWSATLLTVGFLYFWRAEDRYVHVR